MQVASTDLIQQIMLRSVVCRGIITSTPRAHGEPNSIEATIEAFVHWGDDDGNMWTQGVISRHGFGLQWDDQTVGLESFPIIGRDHTTNIQSLLERWDTISPHWRRDVPIVFVQEGRHSQKVLSASDLLVQIFLMRFHERCLYEKALAEVNLSRLNYARYGLDDKTQIGRHGSVAHVLAFRLGVLLVRMLPQRAQIVF